MSRSGDPDQRPGDGPSPRASGGPDIDPRMLALVEGTLDKADAAALEAACAADPELGGQLARLRAAVAALGAPAVTFTEPGASAIRRAVAAFVEHRATAGPSVLEVAASWLEAVDRIVAALVFDGRRPVAMAGFRGAGGGLSFAAGGERLDLDVRPAPGERASDGTWRLRGQFSPAADADADAQADATGEVSGRRVAVLDPAGTVVAADRTDPRGGFTIDVRGPVHAVVIESGVGGFVAEGLAIG